MRTESSTRTASRGRVTEFRAATKTAGRRRASRLACVPETMPPDPSSHQEEGASPGAPGRLEEMWNCVHCLMCISYLTKRGPGCPRRRKGVRVGCACAPRGEDSPKGYRNPEAQSRLYAGFGPYRVQRVRGTGTGVPRSSGPSGAGRERRAPLKGAQRDDRASNQKKPPLRRLPALRPHAGRNIPAFSISPERRNPYAGCHL